MARPSNWETMTPEQRRAYWIALDKQREAQRQRERREIRKLAADPRPRLFADGTRGILVSQDPENPGGWRVSRFDVAGPIGHNCRADYAAALGCALEDGADILRGAAVDARGVEWAALELGIAVGVDGVRLGRVLTRDDRDPSLDVAQYLDRFTVRAQA